MADSKKYDGSQWEHSLRKLTTATAKIEPTIYTDGTAITAYTIKGNTVQSGTPTPSNPVSVNGVGVRTANLFDKQAVTNNERVVYTDGTTASLTGVDVSDYISLEVGETYTLNISSSVVSKTGHLYAMYDSSKNFVDTGQHPSTGATIYSFTVPNGVSFIRFNSLMTELDNVMLVKGSYTAQTFPSYEPYGYKIPISTLQGTSNIYLSEPLYKIGNYADVINADGTITRNIGHIKLSSLTWSDYATNQFSSTQSIDKIYGSGVDTMLCDTYICAVNRSTLVNNAIAPWNSSTSNRLVVQDNQYSTAADWIAAMGDVGIWFILATPTTEQITLPTIPTTEGANSITVDTTVQPSEFTATWTGWHDSSVKEYDGTNWQ